MSGSGRPLGCWEASRAFATLSLMVVVLHTGAATGEEIKLGVPGIKGPGPAVAPPKVKGPERAPSATQASPRPKGRPRAAPGGSAVERTLQSGGLREGLRAAASPKLRIHSNDCEYPDTSAGKDSVAKMRPTRSITAATWASLWVSTPPVTSTCWWCTLIDAFLFE